MSGTPWMYFCPYQENIVRALEELKTREFAAGRYYPAMLDHWLHLPIPPDLPSPGAQHDSIQAALNASGQGTQSVLDIQSLSNEPAFLAVSPMEEEELDLYFGTTRPTHTIVANCTNFLEEIEPGQGRYIIVYADGEPSEIVFAGYSFG